MREGQGPDYRFSLANERTFLAWIRTALSLLAGGLVLDQFATRLRPHALVVANAVGPTVLSMLLCGMAYLRWRDNEIAMRHARGSLGRDCRIPAGGMKGIGALGSCRRSPFADR
jgi:putative membrane protein